MKDAGAHAPAFGPRISCTNLRGRLKNYRAVLQAMVMPSRYNQRYAHAFILITPSMWISSPLLYDSPTLNSASSHRNLIQCIYAAAGSTSAASCAHESQTQLSRTTSGSERPHEVVYILLLQCFRCCALLSLSYFTHTFRWPRLAATTECRRSYPTPTPCPTHYRDV